MSYPSRARGAFRAPRLTKSLIALALTTRGFTLNCATNSEETEWQGGIVVLDSIVLTAERAPIREKESSRFINLSERQDLKDNGGNNLADGLKREGSVGYKAFGTSGVSHGGMNSQLTMRGVNGGELVLINSVPIQGAAGHNYDLNSIPADQIERVEIIKGAASTLYGSNAMSGVINVITRKPAKEGSFKLAVEGGSESYYRSRISGDYFNTSIGFEVQKSGEQKRISYSSSSKYRYDLAPTAAYALNLSTNQHGFELAYLGSITKTAFTKVYDDLNKKSETTDQKQTKHFASLLYKNSGYTGKLFGNHDLMEREELFSTKPGDENQNYNYGFDSDYLWELYRFKINSGINWTYRAADYNNQNWGEKYRNDYALFSEARYTLAEFVTLNAGVREQIIVGENGFGDYDKLLFSGGVNARINDYLNLFANSGQAFRAPSFNQLYYYSKDRFEPNPDLKPESGYTLDAGFKYDQRIISLRLTGFYMNYTDKIESQKFKLNGKDVSKNFNLGEYDSYGSEWQITSMPFKSFDNILSDFSIGTTGCYAVSSAKDQNGREEQASPRLQAAATLAYDNSTFKSQITVNTLQKRERMNPAYTTIDLHSSYKIWQGTLFLNINNLTDEEVITAGNQDKEASASIYSYYDLGRQLKVGYEFDL